MSQNYSYPSSSSSANASVALNGGPIPGSSTLIAGNAAGVETPVSVDSSGNVNVNILTVPPITGTVKAQLQDNNGAPVVLGQTLMATSLPVVIASNQSAVPISAASLPLPTGAATQATLSTLNVKTAGSLVPTAFDEVDLTYVVAGNGIGQIQTAVYKLAASTVKTLTLSYDGSDRLSSVVAS